MANEEMSGLVSKIQSMAADPKEDRNLADASNAVQPDAGGGNLVTLPFTEKFLNDWWLEIARAQQRRTSRETSWDILLDEYMPIVTKSGVAETVKVQAHFRNVHTKLGNLFYRSPDVICTADDPGPGNNAIPQPPPMPGQPPQPLKTMQDVIAVKQAVLKKKLGRDGIKANRLMDELIFDVLAWAGIGLCKVGYKATSKMINKPKLVPAPNQMMSGSIMGLQSPPMIEAKDPATGQTIMEPQQTVVHEEYYARRISPKKGLWDSKLRSTRFRDDAAWVGADYFITPKVAKDSLKMTDEEVTKCGEDDRFHKFEGEDQTGNGGMIHCIEIYCRANLYTDEVHPEAICQLTMVEGLKTRPVVWRPSPDQEFDQNTGRLTQDSLQGFPLHFLTIRDLADSCFPPADSAFTNSEIKQMSTYRRQTIRLRDAAIGKYLFDVDAFDDNDVELLKNGEIGEFIAVQAGKLKDGVDKIFAPTTRIAGSADDQRGYAAVKQDVGETLGIGSNQAGMETDTVRTATESDKVAMAVQARNDKELSRVVDLYLDIVRSLDQLLMRYMTQTEYVEIGGEEAGAVMQAWNGKLITGKYLYDITPDSQLRPDTAALRKETLQYYNLTGKDPMSNRMYVLKRLARQHGMDPAKATQVPPTPPPPQPEPIKIVLTITPLDLDNPKVVTLLQSFGPDIAPTLNIKGQQPEHGGPMEPGDVLSEHMQSNSGGKQNAPGSSNHREGQAK